jgi:cyclophilin family peptidyl-prolyl cis-trans isomerase
MSHRASKATLFLMLAAIVLTAGATTMYADNHADNPIVVMETNKGTIKIECYPDKAPVTVENFLWYVDNKFYDGLVFHRVKPGFVIQGGGFTKDMVKKETKPPIENEAKNGLKNDKYWLSMARTPQINSATSQFFINLVDNDFLNHRNESAQGYGYAVYAKVIEGMEIVDEIGKVQTASKNGMDDVPVTPVIMTKVYRLKEDGKKK